MEGARSQPTVLRHDQFVHYLKLTNLHKQQEGHRHLPAAEVDASAGDILLVPRLEAPVEHRLEQPAGDSQRAIMYVIEHVYE